MNGTSRALLCWAAVALGCSGCQPNNDPDGVTDTGVPPYMPLSQFWKPIGDSPAIDPQNATFINGLLRDKAGGRFFINVDSYNIPIARPSPGTARTDVVLTQQSGVSALRAVPLPPGTQPSNDSDAELAVVDIDAAAGTHTSYEMWQARLSAGKWLASAGAAVDTKGDGVSHDGSGIRGSSISLLMGVLTYEEIKSGGPINHALAWSIDGPNSMYYTPPAASSDGKAHGKPDGIPEGARLQLDPNLDLGTLSLSPTGLRIAQAMQRYGLFCVDTADSSALYAEALGGTGKSWQGLLSYDDVANVPVDHLRVLKLQGQVPIK